MKADVAIVIVTYNSGQHIVDCLESIFAQRASVVQQVIVVDNDSQDETVALIRGGFPQVELVLPGCNLGFASGVNLGVRQSDADFVLLLNPDTVILDHAIDVIVDFARGNPGHGLYGGRTVTSAGDLEPSSCWGLPTLWSMALFAFGITTLVPRNRWLDPESLGNWQRDSVREVGMITGCFLLCSNGVWNELGGLDERYFMYGEDADLAIRAHNAGYRPIVCPAAQLIHEVGGCSETPVQRACLLYRGKASLVRTHWKGPAQWLGLFSLAAGTGIRAVLGRVIPVPGRRDRVECWRMLWRERKSWLRGYADGESRRKIDNPLWPDSSC